MQRAETADPLTAAASLPPKAHRMFVIAVLYLVTDIGFSFLFGGLSTILLDGGVAPATVGMITLLGLAYFLRFLIAPVVDRYGSRRGHYRSWIILTQLVLVAALAGMALLDPFDSLSAVIVLMAVILALCAVHDAAVNGLTVRLLRPSERGIGNGIQVAAATGSIVLGTGGALLVYSAAGWTVTMLVLAAVFVLPLLVLIRFAEPTDGITPSRIAWSSLISFFRLPGRKAFVFGILPALVAGLYLVTAVQSALLLDVGWGLPTIALVLNTYGPVLGVLAGLGMGAAIGRWGRTVPLAVAGAISALAVAAMFPLASGNGWDPLDIAAVLGIQAAYSALATWAYTISMDNTRAEFAATDFSLQVSVVGVLRIIVSAIGLSLVTVLGYPMIIVISAALALAGLVVCTVWTSRNR